MGDTISLLAEIAALVNAVAVVIFLFVMRHGMNIVKKIPGSVMSIDVPNIGRGMMSVGDVRGLIADQLSVVSKEEQEELKKFNTSDGTPAEDVDAEILTTLVNHGLVRLQADDRGQETPGLAPLGYRLLKDFMNIRMEPAAASQ